MPKTLKGGGMGYKQSVVTKLDQIESGVRREGGRKWDLKVR